MAEPILFKGWAGLLVSGVVGAAVPGGVQGPKVEEAPGGLPGGVLGPGMLQPALEQSWEQVAMGAPRGKQLSLCANTLLAARVLDILSCSP